MSWLELELLDRSVFFPRISGSSDVGSSSDSAGQQEEASKDSDGEDGDSWVDPHEYRPSKRSHYNPLVPRLDLGELSRSSSCEDSSGEAEADALATPKAPRGAPPVVRELAEAAAAAAAARTPRLPAQRQASHPHLSQQQRQQTSHQEQQQQPMSAPPGPRFGGSGAPNWDSVIKELKNKPRPEPVRSTYQPTWSAGEPMKRTSAFASQGRQQIETAISQLRPRPGSLQPTERVRQPWQQHQQRTLSPGPQSSQLQNLLPPPTLPKPRVPARPHPMFAERHRPALPEDSAQATVGSGATIQTAEARHQADVGATPTTETVQDEQVHATDEEDCEILEAEQVETTECEKSELTDNKPEVTSEEQNPNTLAASEPIVKTEIHPIQYVATAVDKPAASEAPVLTTETIPQAVEMLQLGEVEGKMTELLAVDPESLRYDEPTIDRVERVERDMPVISIAAGKTQSSEAESKLMVEEPASVSAPLIADEPQLTKGAEMQAVSIAEDKPQSSKAESKLMVEEPASISVPLEPLDLAVGVTSGKRAESPKELSEPPAADGASAPAEPPTSEEELKALAELLSVEPHEARTISDALAGRRKQPKSDEEEMLERLDRTDGLTEEELVKVAQLMNMDQETAKAVARFLITQKPGKETGDDDSGEEAADLDETDAADDTTDAEWERLQQRYFDDPDELRFVRPLRDAADTRDGAESNASRGSSGATGSEVRRRLRDFSDLLLGFDDSAADDASVGDDATSERSFNVESMRARFDQLMSFSDRASIVSSDRTSLAPSSVSETRRRRPLAGRSVSRTSSRASSFAPAAVATSSGEAAPTVASASLQAVGRPVRRAQSDALRSASQLKQIVQIKRMIERRRQQQYQQGAAGSGDFPDQSPAAAAAQHRISGDGPPAADRHSRSPSPPSLPPPTLLTVESPSDDGSDVATASEKASPATAVSATKTTEAEHEQVAESLSQQPSAGEIRLSVTAVGGGTLTVHVMECRGLPAGDAKKQRTDSYAKLILLPDRLKKKTKVKKNSANPLFDESFKFPAASSSSDSVSRSLLVSVWHSTDFLLSDQLLGDCVIDIGSQLALQRLHQAQWHRLSCNSRRPSQHDVPQISGELSVAVRLTGQELHVLVKEAVGLNGVRPAVEPFVKLYLLPDRSKRGKRKTSSVQLRDATAKWNAALKFDGVSAESLDTRSLEFSVWDAPGLGHRQYLGGAQLPARGSLEAAAVWRAALAPETGSGGWAEARLQLRDLRQPRVTAAE